MAELIRSLLAQVDDQIEEVIKVGQTDPEIVRKELRDYVVTTSILRHLHTLLERYSETPNRPHEGIGVWVSGFFGSGKSSFAKVFGYAVGNHKLGSERASTLLAERTNDDKTKLLLDLVGEKIPTHTVIFDISTDRSIKHSAQPLTETMYAAFLKSVGCAQNVDLAELEIALEEEGQLDTFKAAYHARFEKHWDTDRGLVAVAFNRASAVMHLLDPATYPSPDSWLKGGLHRAELSPDRLAARCLEMIGRRKPGHALLFVVDEVGQFVAKDPQKILELQGIVEALGRHGRGRMWLVVTSQERLNEVVSGVDANRVEFARLMDRFPLQVHLERSDISEVTGRRVLRKNATGQKKLRELFDAWRGRLTTCCRVSGGRPLTELDTDGFTNLYPLLPYQIDLTIDIVSGLRTAGGASQHVGGANRTIIKLAHALLTDPRAALADGTVGRLATLDLIYDLVENNIGSDIRAKIAKIPEHFSKMPLAAPVAKAICLLQYAQSTPATAENIAAVLHPAIDAESLLPDVRKVLQELIEKQMIRDGERGYRIPTPAEDDWDKSRAGISLRGREKTILAQAAKGFWDPSPQHILGGTKAFKGGLVLDGRTMSDGDIMFHLYTAEQGAEFSALVDDLKVRSQRETKEVFWAVPIDAELIHEAQEFFRSQEMLKAREVGGDSNVQLLSEERARLRHYDGELRRRLKAACLKGAAFFRGHDRSPSDRMTDVGKAAGEILGRVLPDVFSRFDEAAAKITQADIDTLLRSDNLHGLSPVYARLRLIEDKNSIPVFRTDDGPLRDVLARIENRTSYGETASGRFLADEFGKEPFGWDFDAIRMFSLCLLRAGRVEAVVNGRPFDSAQSVEAKNTWNNNNQFRAAAFRPKVGLEPEHIVTAANLFDKTFGQPIRELAEGAVAAAIRRKLGEKQAEVQEQYERLIGSNLPGATVLRQGLDEMRAALRGTDAQAIQGFNAGHMTIKDAIRRAGDLDRLLTEEGVRKISDAREALAQWAEIEHEPDVEDGLREEAAEMADLLECEDFFKDITRIGTLTVRVALARQDIWNCAVSEAIDGHRQALDNLRGHTAWCRLSSDDQGRLSRQFEDRLKFDEAVPISRLRAERDAAPGRLAQAVEEMLRRIEGERFVTLNARSVFADGIETDEELEAALEALRAEIAPLIAQGKKVFVK